MIEQPTALHSLYYWRIIVSAALIAAVGYFDTVINALSPIELARTAGAQFQTSDSAYVGTQVGFRFWSVIGVPAIAVLLGLVAIWWVPLRRWARPSAGSITGATAFFLTVYAVSQPQQAQAFAETTDKTEIKMILPNESAFWIPDVGDNKTNQVQFDSEQYLSANKVAAKRFEIPHQKLYGTGGKNLLSFPDLYVPTGRLIIVSRSPFSHEWVDAHDRGSSPRKEGFPCQSKEGLNTSMGVSVSTSVSENQAARFLYTFGIQELRLTNEQRDTPAAIFQSVYYGKNLDQVMTEYGRKKVQTLVCNQAMRRSIDQINADMVPMMDEIEAQARHYFESVGITLNFIGWADTVNFDPDVQAAINRKFIAAQDKAASEMLQPYLETLRTIGEVGALRDFVINRTALPTTVVGDAPSFLGMTGGLRLTPKQGSPPTADRPAGAVLTTPTAR